LLQDADLHVLLLDHLVEPLDGGEGYPVGVDGGYRLVVAAQTEGGAEVLGHRPDVANPGILPDEVPGLDRNAHQLRHDFATTHAGEVRLPLGVACAVEGPAAGRQVAAGAEVAAGAQADAAASAHGELIRRHRVEWVDALTTSVGEQKDAPVARVHIGLAS